jgi:hypothetical protein
VKDVMEEIYGGACAKEKNVMKEVLVTLLHGP